MIRLLRGSALYGDIEWTVFPAGCGERIVDKKKFRHFNVAATDDTDEAGGTHFLVKEYVEATHLSAFSEEAKGTFS